MAATTFAELRARLSRSTCTDSTVDAARDCSTEQLDEEPTAGIPLKQRRAGLSAERSLVLEATETGMGVTLFGERLDIYPFDEELIPDYHGVYEPVWDRPFQLMGKKCIMHRGQWFAAEAGVPGYKFSNQRTEVHPLTPEFAGFVADVNELTGMTSNSILANIYKQCEGRADYISSHYDDTRNMTNPDVAAVVYGPGRWRPMEFASRHTKEKVVVDFRDYLPADTTAYIYVMRGQSFQDNLKHAVPICRDPSVSGTRVSLTLRAFEHTA